MRDSLMLDQHSLNITIHNFTLEKNNKKNIILVNAY